MLDKMNCTTIDCDDLEELQRKADCCDVLLKLLVGIELLVRVNANLVDGSPIHKAIKTTIAAAKGDA